MSERLKNLSSSLKNQNRITSLRSSSQLNSKQLFDTLLPNKITKHFQEVYNIIRENPGIFQHQDIEQLSRAEQRKLGVEQALKIMRTLKIDLQKDPYKFLSAMYILSFFGIGLSIKSLVHYLLYIKTILVFRMNDFHEKQLQRANKLQDLGSFSLTQLHHGSFSRGIQTYAIYEHSKKEFNITTNQQRGMKFWIGATAQTATKTIVWAQLIVEGSNYGPHPFIVRLRDQKTHQVLQGITIGDCGPKNGLNVIDNGYILIKDIRVPSKCLLGKLGYVDDNGKYISKISSNQQRFGLHMSPLSSGRAALSLTSLSQSSAALSIAIRYACQRRQFKINENEDQVLIIDYPMVRFRLMVPLATNIVYFFGGNHINKLYIDNNQNFTDPTKKIVSQLHATSAVLKAKASWFTNQMITQCRQVLGGHGYSSFSGLGRFYNDNDVNSTWQGDNNMLLQQTSKYLLKTLRLKQKASIISLQFVYEGVQSFDPTEQTLNNLSQLRILLQDNFIQRHNLVIKQMTKIQKQLSKKGLKSSQLETAVWNSLQPYFCNQLSLSYGDLVYFQSLYKVVQSYKGTQYNKQFLSRCLKLWTQNTLIKYSIKGVQTRKKLQKLIIEGCQLLYNDCITVTDVLAPPSFMIGSPFAEENGQCMKSYLNMLFTGKKSFGRAPWFQRILELRNNS